MINIILSELINDKLKKEEVLERLINSKTPVIDEVINEIKLVLREIVLIEEMILKWKSYSSIESINNNEN